MESLLIKLKAVKSILVVGLPGNRLCFQIASDLHGMTSTTTSSQVEDDQILGITNSSVQYTNELIMTYWQLCYFMNFHFTFSMHTNSIYIYLEGIKFSTQGLNQSFVIKLANPIKLNWKFVPNSFLFSLKWLAPLPYLVYWARPQCPHVGHDLCLQPLWTAHCTHHFLSSSSPFLTLLLANDYLFDSDTQGDFLDYHSFCD